MNKKTLYLHIGMGKTGTTALQHFFWANRKILAQKGYLYPEIGVISGAHHLLSPHHPKAFADSWDFLDLDIWGPKLAEVSYANILISSELIAWGQEEILVDFCKKLQQWFTPKVIIYLRRQDNMIMAGYNQQVKVGWQKKKIEDILTKQLPRFNYLNILKPWQAVLKKEHIIIRPYEKQQLYQQDLIKDFLHHALKREFSSEFEIQPDNRNPRLEGPLLEFKRLLNNVCPDDSEKFNDVLFKFSQENNNSSSKPFSGQALLPPQTRLDILKKNEKINSTIAREYLGHKDGRLFYDPAPDINEAWEPELVLTKSEMNEIVRFMSREDKQIAHILSKAINNGLQLKEPMALAAARELEDVIKKSAYMKKNNVATKSSQKIPSDNVYNMKQRIKATIKRALWHANAVFSKAKPETLYLHIGTQKTGTTALQNFFAMNASSLKKNHVLYPETGRAPMGAHHPLVNSMRDVQNAIFMPERSCREYLEDLKLETFQSPNVLLSSEILHTITHLSKFSPLEALADNAKVILYLRRHDQYFESCYSTYVKSHGYTGTIEQFIQDKRDFRYAELCDRWAHVLGEENIIVRAYEQEQFRKGNIFSDFLDVLGLELTENYSVPKRNSNPSLSRDALEFKRLVNFLAPDVHDNAAIRNVLIQLSRTQGKEALFVQHNLIPNAERLKIIDEYADDYSYVARKYLKRGDGKLFYAPLPDISEPWESPAELAEKDVADIAQLIIKQDVHVANRLQPLIEQGLRSKAQNVRHAAQILRVINDYLLK